jgi:hypothetical protein
VWCGTRTHSAGSRFPSQGVRNFSVPVGLDSSVLVDLVVVGSVAVSEKGKLETGCLDVPEGYPGHSPLACVHAESLTSAPVPLTLQAFCCSVSPHGRLSVIGMGGIESLSHLNQHSVERPLPGLCGGPLMVVVIPH